MRDTINLLNELLKLDRTAISNVFGTRHPCNNTLAEHPSVQVSYNKAMQVTTVGPLGLLNALFGTVPDGVRKDWGQIVVLRSEKDQMIDRFVHIEELDDDAPK